MIEFATFIGSLRLSILSLTLPTVLFTFNCTVPISTYKWAGYEFDVEVDQHVIASDDGNGVTGKISCSPKFKNPNIIPWPIDRSK